MTNALFVGTFIHLVNTPCCYFGDQFLGFLLLLFSFPSFFWAYPLFYVEIRTKTNTGKKTISMDSQKYYLKATHRKVSSY